MTEPRLGTVLVFKAGVTKEQIEEALKKINNVIDGTYYVGGKPYIREFNPEYGGPVWYIP